MRHPIHQNKTMRDVRQQTRAKIQHLTALGYRVKEMWECEWQRIIQSDNHLKEFVETLDIVTPLNPREAFFGGRTNAIKPHHKVEEERTNPLQRHDFVVPVRKFGMRVPHRSPRIHQPTKDHRHQQILRVGKM